MKKLSMITTLAVIFALFSFTPLWAQNSASGSMTQTGFTAQDGSMQDIDLSNTVTISGVVYDSGTAGTGMSIDEGDGVITTVYGIGSMNYWNELGVEKPIIGEAVTIEAVEVTFSDGTTRLIALSMTLEDGTAVVLRNDDGTPVWRGGAAAADKTNGFKGGRDALTAE